MFSSIAQTLGPFRLILLAMTVALVAAAPFALGESYYDDWRIVPTVVSPVLTVILLFLLPLDMLMSFAFAAGDQSRRSRMRRVVVLEVLMLLALLGAWAPFLSALFPD